MRCVVYEQSPALEGLNVEQVPGDVLDVDSLKAAFSGASVVYHLAALISIDGDPEGKVHAVNVDGAGNVALAALECRVRRLVHTSSIHAFEAEPRDQPLDEERARATGAHNPAYDRSKAAGERAVRALSARGLDVVIVHPSAVLGPNDFSPSRMGATLLDLALGRLPALVDGGFDWVDARDVARGMRLAASHGRSGANYLLTGHWHSLPNLFRMAACVAGVRPPPWVLPMAMARALAPLITSIDRARGLEPRMGWEALRALDGPRRVVRTKALRELGYAARPTLQTLRDTFAFFRQRGKL